MHNKINSGHGLFNRSHGRHNGLRELKLFLYMKVGNKLHACNFTFLYKGITVNLKQK